MVSAASGLIYVKNTYDAQCFANPLGNYSQCHKRSGTHNSIDQRSRSIPVCTYVISINDASAI